MALGQCRECGKEVSDSAKVCPSCGIKTPIRKSVTTIQAIVVIVIGVWILSSNANNSSPNNRTLIRPNACWHYRGDGCCPPRPC